MADALQVRNKMKARKPRFIMQDSWKRKELPRKWKKPRGLHSKMRMRKKGHPKLVSPGYKSPALARGLSREGFKVVHIASLKELELVKNQEAIIIKRIGEKKKTGIVREAVKRGLRILNLAEPEKYISRIEEKLKQKKLEKEALLQKEKEKKEKKEKKEEKKEAKEEKLEEAVTEEKTEKEKKEAERKEKEKVLTKRESLK